MWKTRIIQGGQGYSFSCSMLQNYDLIPSLVGALLFVSGFTYLITLYFTNAVKLAYMITWLYIPKYQTKVIFLTLLKLSTNEF